MKLALLILTSCALIGIIEILKRRFLLPASITRRAIHIGTASVAGIAPFFVSQIEIVIVSVIFAVVLLYGRRRQFLTAIHSVERKTLGEVHLPLGVAITALFFLPNDLMAFQFGVFVMGISDPLAGVIGERFGKHKIRFFGSTKSIEGSAVFFICTLILTLFFVPVFSYQLIIIAAILTIVEFLAIYGLDNLVLPILGAFLIQFLI